jgi:hypothetical protein
MRRERNRPFKDQRHIHLCSRDKGERESRRLGFLPVQTCPESHIDNLFDGFDIKSALKIFFRRFVCCRTIVACLRPYLVTRPPTVNNEQKIPYSLGTGSANSVAHFEQPRKNADQVFPPITELGIWALNENVK